MMNFEDENELESLAKIFEEAESYPPHLTQASIEVEDEGKGIVKWDYNINAFKVLYYACRDELGSLDDLIGRNAVIQNDGPITKGIIQPCLLRPDEVWFKIETGEKNDNN